MATFRTLSWNGIPTGVKATDTEGSVRVELSPRFQITVDDIATRVGRTDGDAYLDDWRWSEPEDRPGTAREVAEAVAGRLEEAFPPGRLGQFRRELIARLGERRSESAS